LGNMIKYIPVGVCSKEISFYIIDGKLKNVEFVKGCAGNAQGVSRLEVQQESRLPLNIPIV